MLCACRGEAKLWPGAPNLRARRPGALGAHHDRGSWAWRRSGTGSPRMNLDPRAAVCMRWILIPTAACDIVNDITPHLEREIIIISMNRTNSVPSGAGGLQGSWSKLFGLQLFICCTASYQYFLICLGRINVDSFLRSSIFRHCNARCGFWHPDSILQWHHWAICRWQWNLPELKFLVLVLLAYANRDIAI